MKTKPARPAKIGNPYLKSLRFQLLGGFSVIIIAAVLMVGLIVLFAARGIFLEQTRMEAATAARAAMAALNTMEDAADPPKIEEIGRAVFDPMIFSSITFFGPDDAVIWSSLD